MSPKKRVAIVGGGVSGLSCAVQILNYFGKDVDLTLFSDKLTPFTTGDISAGVWSPFLCGNTDQEKVRKWMKISHDYFAKLWKEGDAGAAGICLQPIYRVTATDKPLETYWTDIPYGAKQLSHEELIKLNRSCNKNYKSGIQFVSFSAEPIKLLPFWFKKFQNTGGKFISKKVDGLDEINREFGPFDVIINAPGLGAKEIVGDNLLMPIRGQVTRISAPWIYHTFLDDDGNYIIVNSESVVLGGTHQDHDYNITPYKNDSEYIWDGCKNLVPAIVNSKILGENVGLRPGRDSVRLEMEIKPSKNSAQPMVIVHNYGHGGSGVCFSWGCAAEVLDIVKDYFDNFKSKL